MKLHIRNININFKLSGNQPPAGLIEQVAKLHQDVLDWTHIADALAPDGIPGELLAEAHWINNGAAGQIKEAA